MRNLKLAFGICFLAVIFLAGCKTAENIVKQSEVGQYAFIDIDPMVIGATWTHIITVPLNQLVYECYYHNPDHDAPIQFATLVLQQYGIIGYSYMINNRINLCGFNVETNAYESTWDILEEDDKKKWYDDYNTYFDLGGSC